MFTSKQFKPGNIVGLIKNGERTNLIGVVVCNRCKGDSFLSYPYVVKWFNDYNDSEDRSALLTGEYVYSSDELVKL